MSDLTPEQLEYLLQFQHPEKMLARFPGTSPALAAALFDITTDEYAQWGDRFTRRVREAAEQLVADPTYVEQFRSLPFAEGQTVVGFGDSITDFSESWFEILRCSADLLLRDRRLDFHNLGISGDTTADLICRCLEVVNAEPDWVLCMVGTNDCRCHGLQPTKMLVSPEETARNLEMLVNFARTQSSAKWVWMTPCWVDEEKIAQHPLLGQEFQMAWHNSDLDVVADLIRTRPEPSIDLQAVFGNPTPERLLMPDGLHPSTAGHQLIARTVVEALATAS